MQTQSRANRAARHGQLRGCSTSRPRWSTNIGLEETDDGIWAIHFNTILLATLDERDYIMTG